jgi:hypothetical protein
MMKALPIRTSRCTGRRILFIVVGVGLLILSANQVAWQRWLLAAIQATAGAGAVWFGVCLTDAAIMRKSTGAIVKTFMWTAALIGSVVLIAVITGPVAADRIGMSMPYLSALWVLAVGVRFAERRVSVVLTALAASLLLMLQCALLGFGAALSRYNAEARTALLLLLGAAALSGSALVMWFVRSKLFGSRPSN